MLQPGSQSPVLTLTHEGRTVRVPERGRPQILFFFKVGCPTTPIAIPALEALRRAYAALTGGPSIVPVSQDDARTTERWASEHGLVTPFMAEGAGFPASAAFGLTSVPTLVLLDRDGAIVAVQEGWSRDGYEEVSRKLAELCNGRYQKVTAEGGPAFRPG